MNESCLSGFNELLTESIGSIELFVKFNTLGNQVSFLEFRSDIYSLMANLIRLWHQSRIRTPFCKRERAKSAKLRHVIIKSLVECSYIEEASLQTRMAEWEQIVQEENVRKGVVAVFGSLAKKLRKLQTDLGNPQAKLPDEADLLFSQVT